MIETVSVGYEEFRNAPVRELADDFGKTSVELKKLEISTR